MSHRQRWAIVVYVAALLELIGLVRTKRGDTLSEFTWAKTRHPVVAGLVLALIGWLPYHLSHGRFSPGLGVLDIASAIGGAVLGVTAALRGRK